LKEIKVLIRKAIEILRKDGFDGLAKRLKRRISLGLMKKSSATTVTHKEAMKYFEIFKDDYDRLISAIYPYVSSDSIILDIGANIGYFTFLLAERLNFNGSVYLFEPVPHLAALCRATFRDVPFGVNVFDFGLSDRDAEEDMFIAVDGNIGWNTIVPQWASGMTKIRIQLKSFDACEIEVTPHLIKIDVEGAEYRVLRGMLGSLRKWHNLPIILCEVAGGKSHPAWESEMSVFMEMEEIGYTICDLGGSPIDVAILQETTDVLFIPRKQ
jgi:FkbM family methyltransferase